MWYNYSTMNSQFDDFIKVLGAFEKENLEYVLIGGVAVTFHGLERFTRDLDIFIKMTPKNVDSLKKALKTVFNDPSIEEITFNEIEKYPVIRYGTPSNFYICIIGKLGEFAEFQNIACEVIEFKGVKIKVATPETLYELKKNTYRDRDKADLVFLEELIKFREKQ